MSKVVSSLIVAAMLGTPVIAAAVEISKPVVAGDEGKGEGKGKGKGKKGKGGKKDEGKEAPKGDDKAE